MGNGGMKKVLLYVVGIFMDCGVDGILTHLWQVLDANWGFARQRIKRFQGYIQKSLLYRICFFTA